MVNLILIYFIFSLFDLFKNLNYFYETTSLINKVNKNKGNIEELSVLKNQIIVILDRAAVSDEHFLKEYDTGLQLVVQNSTVQTVFPYFGVEDRILNMLRNAKGFYKRLAIRNINPIFLIERFFKMPSFILQQFNLNKSSKINGTLNIIWSVVFWLFTPLLESMRTSLFEFIATFF